MKTEERNKLIFEAWSNGESIKSIAERFHCTPSTANHARELYQAQQAMQKTLAYKYILAETKDGNDHRTAKRLWVTLNRRCETCLNCNVTEYFPYASRKLTGIRGKGIRILFFLRNATPQKISLTRGIGPIAMDILKRVKARVNHEFGLAGDGGPTTVKTMEEVDDEARKAEENP